MKLAVTAELLEICAQIVAERKTAEQWAAIESDDMFQSQNLVGGFDAAEMSFTFSQYDAAGDEYWFQLTLDEIQDLARGRVTSIDARLAEG